jgi:hypothetical protein
MGELENPLLLSPDLNQRPDLKENDQQSDDDHDNSCGDFFGE